MPSPITTAYEKLSRVCIQSMKLTLLHGVYILQLSRTLRVSISLRTAQSIADQAIGSYPRNLALQCALSWPSPWFTRL